MQAHAKRMAEGRNAKVSLSEAGRDLIAKGLQQSQKPWELALRSLPFIAWRGGKPAIPRPVGTSQSPLSTPVLEDRKDRF